VRQGRKKRHPEKRNMPGMCVRSVVKRFRKKNMSVNPANLTTDPSACKKAMVLAAGLGTRMGSLTQHTPKALIKVHGMPLLEIVIRRLMLAGIADIVVNVHHHAEQILRFLEEQHHFGIQITLSHERAAPLETGGGVKLALPLLQDVDMILVHNADVLTNLSIEHFCNAADETQVPVFLSVRERKATRYLLADEKMSLCGWEDARSGEKKWIRKPEGNMKRYGFSGIQILRTRILPALPAHEKFSLMDFYLDLARDHTIRLIPDRTGFWYNIGNPEILAQVNEEITPGMLSNLTGISP
jgi:N-acetyl-alpha-D-muramate 1-phosphate uridylyltransferase